MQIYYGFWLMHGGHLIETSIVRDASGAPLAGRYCTVVDAQGSDWFDILSLEVTVDSCGPSNEFGEIEIIGLRVRGGATKELRLEARVEGAAAELSSASSWQADGRLYYLSAEQPTFGKIDLITLQGHDSVPKDLALEISMAFSSVGSSTT